MPVVPHDTTTVPPAISDRSTNGTVTLGNPAGNKMVYTVDGSGPKKTRLCRKFPSLRSRARCFRFTALQAIWRSGWTSAAEIPALPAGGSGD